MDTLEELAKRTHVVEYSPNCPDRFLVRLVGPGRSVIDKKSYYSRETQDILGFGRTLRQAASRALAEKKSSDDRFFKRGVAQAGARN